MSPLEVFTVFDFLASSCYTLGLVYSLYFAILKITIKSTL